MAETVELRSAEQDLGDLVRSIRNNTDLNDVAPGSDLATLLEAVAKSSAQIRLNAIKILQSTNLEALVGQALDKKGESIKIPNGEGGVGRKPAKQAAGKITVGSSFAKISSKLYSGKPAPFAGSNKLYVENAGQFPAIGSIYIGRGTADRFEGPIPYTTVANDGSFWTITLSTSLTKSHLNSDLVVVAQGGDRAIQAGTQVLVPANTDAPAVVFTTTQSVVLPDGEAEIDIPVICSQSGESGNVLAGSVKQFASAPFAGATVTNKTSYINGKSTENDEDYRQRIKNYPATLSRGTSTALLSAILGVSDPDTGSTIQSAVVLEPVEPGDFARVFLDDGAGLEPVFGEQAYELLLQSASGQESKFRVAKFPITPAVAEGSATGPFTLADGLSIVVKTDEVVETYYINIANYQNINSTTAYEIVRDLNSQSNIVGWRTMDGGKRVVAMDLSGKAEVLTIESGTLQEILGLPTAVVRPIFVYKNSVLQSFRGHTATISTQPVNSWDVDETDFEDVRVKVDGVTQTFSVFDSDFSEFGTTVQTATATQWASVLSKKVAGVKFTVSGQVLVWSTYQTFSETGTLEILTTKADDTPALWIGEDKVWTPESSGGILKDAGYPKDYSLNRFTGEIVFTKKPEVGSTIEVGSRSTRGHIRSTKTPTGLFALNSLSPGVGNARVILGFDGEFAIRSSTVGAGDYFEPTKPDPSGAANIIRLNASSTSVFRNAKVGDWLYLCKDTSAVPALTWGSNIEGMYKLKAVGLQTYEIDTNFIGLSGATEAASRSAAVRNGRDVVTITHTNHGLQTGDLITVSTANPIGGISAVDLSVTDAVITKISNNQYQYTALASATSDTTGSLDLVGTNCVTVTQALHGFSSGALVDVSVSSGFGGISALDLSVSNTKIEVLTANTYRYRANAAATSAASGTVDTVTYIADTWVEFETSDLQLTDWNALLTLPQALTDKSVYLFRSTAYPQLVDFGVVGSLTVDDVVTIINDSIATGVATKVTPQQIEVRTSDYESGTAAVLAVIGSAANVFAPSTDSSQQSHIGYSNSGLTQAGFPVVDEVVLPTSQIAGYPTRTYLNVDKDLTNITTYAANPVIQSHSSIVNYPEGFENLWLTGKQSGLAGRVYNNQTTAPFTGLMRGEDVVKPNSTSNTTQTSPDTFDRYANYSLRLRDLSFNNHDKLVVEMDLDPTDKTVAIQLAKKAKIFDMDSITGSGKGQVISFRLKDPEDSDKEFFDATSVYKDYDFSDFKLLTKSVGLYREDVSDRALVVRSTSYGAAHRLRLSIGLPVLPDQDELTLSHTNEFYEGEARLNLSVQLTSQSVLPGSPLTSGSYKVVSSTSGTLYDWRITGGNLNTGSEYVAGNVLNISGLSNLSGSYYILSSTYNAWAGSIATTTPGSSTVSVSQTNHGYLNGDMIDITAGSAIGGISSANLSGTFEVAVINANTFTYVAAAASPINTGTIASVSRPAINIANSTGNVTNGFAVVTVTFAGHGLQTGNIVDVTTATPIGGISAVDLSQIGTTVTVIDANTFTYIAGAVASSTTSGFIDSIDRAVLTYTTLSATTTLGSSTVSLTQVSHGYSTGDIVSVTSINSIGGISAANLTVASAVITVTGANTFTYSALASSPAASGALSSLSGGSVTVKSPGSGGLSPSAVYSAAQSPIQSWELLDKTLQDLATAINQYYPDFPVATAEAIGTNFVANPVALPTYMVYPNAVAYTDSDMTGAFNWHAFNCKLAGSAGIWQYDSSLQFVNNIKATVQAEDSIYPTTTEASGTGYFPINEEVYLVPTNTKSLASWLAFKASSSLNILADISRTRQDKVLQISSKQDGSAGAVAITGVTANEIETSVIGNASVDKDAILLNILNADAKALTPNTAVLLKNLIASEIQRPYRQEPVGVSITSANTENINTYFRPTNALKYVRVNASKGRLIFLRDGMGPLQSEHLSTGNDITFANLGAGLVQVTGALGTGLVGTGKLSARVGDMMYIQPSATGFTVDQRCKKVDNSLTGTNPNAPEYLGYPVVHVINDYNIVIIAPNITNFSTISLGSGTDLVFLPAIWNEKNIRTNRKEGADFDALHNNSQLYFLVKSLGQGFVSVWIQNSGSEATDDLKLDTMSVGTDDIAIFGEGFDPANQGSFRIVAHNGKNHLIVYNPSGGIDELMDINTLENGGTGDRKWRVGPIIEARPLRILAGESVRIGDKLRISTPSASTQWFNDVFIGSWSITGIGYQAVDYTGDPLPHTTSSGAFDQSYICPYIEFEMPNAPLSVTDSVGAHVDSFLIADNDSSIGFVEGTPLSVVRLVVGQGVSPLNPELADLFLVPKLQQAKLTDNFGTTLVAFGKAGYQNKTYQGIDGYKVYDGLPKMAHRIIDGLPTNTTLYPGYKAAGTNIECLPSLLRSIQLSLQVRPKDGVTLNSITDLVKSTVANYINRLGVGRPVVLSEIVKVVQLLPGVFSVKVLNVYPAADDDRIVVGDIEKAFVLDVNRDITVG